MENILLVLNASTMEMPAFNFACYLSDLTHSKLTAIFLKNPAAEPKNVAETVGTEYFGEEEDDNTSTLLNNKMIRRNIFYFEETCRLKAIKYEILDEEKLTEAELIAETRYADLIITDANTSFTKDYEDKPSNFVRELLKESECPVIIAPEHFKFIDRIIFAYDGTRSSAFAMKQFSYLFPQFEDKAVTVFHVDKDAVWSEEEKKKLTGWLQNRYSSIGFEIVDGNVSEKLVNYLRPKQNVFIVMGAYGRSELSMFLKRSHADLLFQKINQPIFIAHH